MKRTHAFLITLFLWLTLGIGASVMYFDSRNQETEPLIQQPTETEFSASEAEAIETEATETKTEIETETANYQSRYHRVSAFR